MGRPKKIDSKIVVFNNVKDGSVQTLSIEAYAQANGTPQVAHLKFVGEMTHEEAEKYINSKKPNASRINVMDLSTDTAE